MTIKILSTILLVLIVKGTYSQTRINRDIMLNLVNAKRLTGYTCGGQVQEAAPPLVWDKALEQAARKHADDMARNEFLSHTGSDKSTLKDRVEREKFNWSIIGENVASGHENEEIVVNGWMNSPGHCKNIMNPEFRYMGAAVSSKGYYWVQVFADKAK